MVSCSQTDLIEIACMERLALKIITVEGEEIIGKAVDLVAHNRNEYLKLIQLDGSELQIVLEKVLRICALTENRYFQEIKLNKH